MISRTGILHILFLAILLLLGSVFGFFIPNILNTVQDMGHYISQPDMAYDYTAGVFTAMLIGFSIPFWPVSKADQRCLVHLWLARCIITLGFMLLYENHYGLDAYSYFHWATDPNAQIDLSSILSSVTGTEMIIAITWFLNQLLPFSDSYHALKVVFSAIGLVATYIVYRGSILLVGKDNRSLLYFLGLFPSLIFWSSILGKDPINMLGTALYFYGVIGFYMKRRYVYIGLVVLGIVVASSIRLWTALILLVPLVTVGIKNVRGFIQKMVCIVLFILGINYLFQQFTAMFGVTDIQSTIATTQMLSRSWSYGGSGQEVPVFSGFGDMLSFAPKGMFTALFRPFPGEVGNIFGLMAGIENLFFLGFFGLALIRTGLGVFRDSIVFWLLNLILFWSFIYGFISYQNLGAAVRFKLQVMPIMIWLAFHLKRKDYLAVRSLIQLRRHGTY